MDPRYPVSREELYMVQMDVKQLYSVQNSHTERLIRLEKRQADNAAMKSAWNSPFPSGLSGTPQHGLYSFLNGQHPSNNNTPATGPIPMSSSEMLDHFDEQGQNLLGSLHLDTEEEPTKRAAASRANSVRFDESAKQTSSWAHNGRQSGDFGPIRPSSGLGMVERSFSHKSDGRHSSAGHSVHSTYSHHSAASGRNSSYGLGLDTAFAANGVDDDLPAAVPERPPGLLVLGSVPSIVRCWLTSDFAHDTLLYADICTGSQQSVLDYSLVKELGLVDNVQRDVDGTHRIRLPVYLTEATVVQPSARGASPAPQMPCIRANFEVSGVDQPESRDARKTIRIFIGSDTLREHSADILLSQNLMTLYGNEREKLSVPFVRPEDKAAFKNIRTMTMVPDKPRLNATARPFVFGEPQRAPVAAKTDVMEHKKMIEAGDAHSQISPSTVEPAKLQEHRGYTRTPDGEDDGDRLCKEPIAAEEASQDAGTSSSEAAGERPRHEAGAVGIWMSWRQGSLSNGKEHGENGLLSGYQPAGRVRTMKVLKPNKPTGITTPVRANASTAYEALPHSRTSGELRRKSQPATEGTASGAMRRKPDRPSIGSVEGIHTANAVSRDSRSVSSTAPRTPANPVGGASAFSWMAPVAKPKTPTTAE